MRFLYLRYVIAVADEGSFTKAAHRLYVSQPAISAGVASVENAVDFQIFERNKTGAKLTRQGRDFVDRARPIIEQMDAFEERYVSDPNLRG